LKRAVAADTTTARSNARVIGLLACALLACAPQPGLAPVPAAPTTTTSARSANGVVVSGAPLATAVGVRVLEAGGNAVDAAVATAFALAVVEPTMSGIGGRTQLVLRTADGRIAAIDGTTEVPRSYTGGPVDDDDAYGWSTIAVPGTVAALAHALREHGTWSLARVLAPAIELADQGFRLNAEEARRLAGVAPALREFEGTRATFLRPDGSPRAAADVLRQPDLAATLRLIASGGEDAFYRGDIARRMAADIGAHGGLVTLADLADYRAEESIVVRGHYRGHELVGSYLPASGATTIEILQILEHFDLRSATGVDWIVPVARALLAGFQDRTTTMLPASAKAAWLTSSELAAERAGRIRIPASAGRAATGEASGRARIAHEPEHTTHLSVADRWGGVVALTQSVGPTMGSKVVTPGLGFVYAATMEYLGELEPGTRRHWSSQSPLLILRDGQPIAVLGGAGARRILSGVVETVVRLLDERLPLQQALAAPRLHPSAGRIDLEVRPGTAWPAAVHESLRALGFTVTPRSDAPYFARINAIVRDGNVWVGATDPRGSGAAAAAR
jgi:gamma-glutamyltranspeptidase/glutathione hydrolase